jgi:hypothetical protein
MNKLLAKYTEKFLNLKSAEPLTLFKLFVLWFNQHYGKTHLGDAFILSKRYQEFVRAHPYELVERQALYFGFCEFLKWNKNKIIKEGKTSKKEIKLINAVLKTYKENDKAGAIKLRPEELKLIKQ